MTYRKRYEALGYNVSSWARYCGVARQTIIRHNQMEQGGELDKIPKPFFVILDLLEGFEEMAKVEDDLYRHKSKSCNP